MQEFFEKAISEKLIFPILGISAQSSYDFTLTATELMKKLFRTSSKMIQMYHFFFLKGLLLFQIWYNSIS